MKILVFSDVENWVGYEEQVDKIQPNVVVLAGDLTSDGLASFWHDSIGRKLSLPPQRMHVNKFYHFLRHVGKKSEVMVVKGDHDEDFEGSYVPEKINRIHGCAEISGKTIEEKGIRFLGLGFNDTYYVRRLKPIIQEFKEKIEVVIMHGP
jgi:predicted phosphodiesterase